jgi:hypothetical protein
LNPECGSIPGVFPSQNSKRLENGPESQYLWGLLTLEKRSIQPDGTIENRRLDGWDRLRQFGLDTVASTAPTVDSLEIDYDLLLEMR